MTDHLAGYYFRDNWYAQVPRVHRWHFGDEREPFASAGTLVLWRGKRS